MTRDDIIEMALDAGMGPAVAWPEYYPTVESFFQAAYAAGAAAEQPREVYCYTHVQSGDVEYSLNPDHKEGETEFWHKKTLRLE